MSDIIDRAQQLEEFDRDRALDRVLGAAHLRGPDDLAACVECGEAIGLERRAARPGALRCVECEGLRERVLKLYRKG